MSGLGSPRLLVVIDGATAPVTILADLKAVTSLGLAELKALIAAGAPTLDIEMFTNDWYDGGADRVLDLLSRWETQGVGYILREAPPGIQDGVAAEEASRISLQELRNIISTDARVSTG